MLFTNSQLNNAAQAHSNWMQANQRMTHDENGEPFTARLIRAGYHYRNAGENIAAGQRTPEAVFKAWMNSPGHKRNILNPAFRDVGFGRAGNYWTVNFGSTAARLADSGSVDLPGGVEDHGE